MPLKVIGIPYTYLIKLPFSRNIDTYLCESFYVPNIFPYKEKSNTYSFYEISGIKMTLK